MHAGSILLAVLILAIAAVTTTISAAAGPHRPAQAPAGLPSADRLTALADEITRVWAPGVDRAGRMREIVTGEVEDGYGQAMWGYALLRTAQRTRDPAMLASAERILLRRTRTSSGGAFEQLAMSSTYADPRLRRLMSPGLRSAMRRTLIALGQPKVGKRARACQQRTTCYNNLKLVDAVASLTLTSTGLESPDPDTKLGSPRRTAGEARGLFLSLLSLTLPGTVMGSRGRMSLQSPVIISDPSRNPLAYHALSTGLLERAAALDPEIARSRPVRALRDAALRGTLAATGPDGDITYMGRGQRQVWTSAATLSAALSRLRDAQAAGDETYARELAALARGAHADLTGAAHAARHAGTGLQITPSTAAHGIDKYASRTTYVALTLYWLNLASDAARELRPMPWADRHFSARAPSYAWSDPSTGLIVRRKENAWIAVHETATHPEDSRYDAGLLSLKWRDSKARWVEMLEPRPFTDREGIEPLRFGPGRADGTIFQAIHHTITPDGIRTCGAFSKPTGRPAHRRTCLSYTIERTGLRLQLRNAGRQPVVFTVPLRAGHTAVRHDEHTLRVSGLLWQASKPITRALAGMPDDASALASRISRVTMTITPARDGSVDVVLISTG